jgi:preprotein translocase subunit SecG
VTVYLSISLIIISVALIQSKGIGLGGLSGADTGGVYSKRRGVEKILFWVTIGLGIAFFGLTIFTVIVS